MFRQYLPFTLALVCFLLYLALFAGGSSDDVQLLREGMYYEKLSGKAAQCGLCPHNCKLGDGQTGLCRVRKNIGGRLFSLVYNKPVSMNVDPVEKKPFFHFLPGSQVFSIATVGCNLSCSFCQNWEISQSSPESTKAYDVTAQQVVDLALKNGAKNIAFTYTEPTVYYEYMLDIAKLAKKNGIKTMMITCGYINEKPFRELAKYLDAIDIDLKGFTGEFYSKYTTGSLEPVLKTAKLAKEEKLHAEITYLVIPGTDDKPENFKKLAKWIRENLGADTPLHFLRFFPKFKLTNRPPTPVETLETARKIAITEGLKFVYIGNAQSEGEDTYCPKCGKKIIDRSGYNINSMNIKDGKCSFCGEPVHGVWK